MKNITIGDLAARVAEIALQQIQDSLSTIQLTERDVVGEAIDGVFGAQRSVDDELEKTGRMRSMLDEAAIGRAPGLFMPAEPDKPTCKVLVTLKGNRRIMYEDVTGTLVDQDGYLVIDRQNGEVAIHNANEWVCMLKEPYHAEEG